ncbi:MULTISPECIES: AraC family transcriptional regulator [Myroides]|uniref:Helix-turn-helix domain-containing protein n=1 Tax=Myroides albus TaxID=2562892 RepID=A0A6I3LTX3_9FLAO|nr:MULTISPECIES: helix-turn-helix transcriptional regulator [Myroides]MTG99425.1 helix-turn-helix domain-containing protein [Myroides albus]MVX35936.1 helix-turn-helix domain-containing protein [Myroides sp. LoEW2-1]UVD80426.1 helix-turn-helix transcriptional regulator [Myroides albus]
MAYLEPTDYFKAEDIDLPVVGIASNLVLHDSGYHHHDHHYQILYAPSGCMTLTTDDRQVILPPSRLMFIPPTVKHRVTFRNVVDYRSIYIRSEYFNKLDSGLKVIAVNPLLRELIERICFWKFTSYDQRQENLLSVFWDELELAKSEDFTLKIPEDYRLKSQIEKYVLHKELPPFLSVLANSVGASEKTISRIFKKETGMNYQDWRLQWRLFRSIELLAERKSISEVAFALQFSSDSAFIDFFKKHTGKTPLKYMTEI